MLGAGHVTANQQFLVDGQVLFGTADGPEDGKLGPDGNEEAVFALIVDGVPAHLLRAYICRGAGGRVDCVRSRTTVQVDSARNTEIGNDRLA